MNKKLQELKQKAEELNYETTRVNKEISEFSAAAPVFFWDEYDVQELYLVNDSTYTSINSNMSVIDGTHASSLKADVADYPDKVFELSVGEVRQILDFIKELVKSR